MPYGKPINPYCRKFLIKTQNVKDVAHINELKWYVYIKGLGKEKKTQRWGGMLPYKWCVLTYLDKTNPSKKKYLFNLILWRNPRFCKYFLFNELYLNIVVSLKGSHVPRVHYDFVLKSGFSLSFSILKTG